MKAYCHCQGIHVILFVIYIYLFITLKQAISFFFFVMVRLEGISYLP